MPVGRSLLGSSVSGGSAYVRCTGRWPIATAASTHLDRHEIDGDRPVGGAELLLVAGDLVAVLPLAVLPRHGERVLRGDALDEPLVAEEVAREVHVAVVDEHAQRVAGRDDLVEDRAGVVVLLDVLRVDVVAGRVQIDV